jgi:putative addiction module component (TIGR02574 family)
MTDHLSEDENAIQLTAAQTQELDRRAEDADLHPEELLSWEDVKSQALARLPLSR